jgi:hypothetical protein
MVFELVEMMEMSMADKKVESKVELLVQMSDLLKVEMTVVWMVELTGRKLVEKKVLTKADA